jgi:hypothetical protein
MRIDYTVVRGDSRTLELELTYADGTLPDLVDADISFIVDGLFTKTVTDPDLSSGEAEITLDPDDTDGAPDVRVAYRYNVQVTQDDGTVLTPQSGLFIVLPDVTA